MPRKDVKKPCVDALEDDKKKRTPNWNQPDTELMVQFIMEHGRLGILSKETNVGTNKQREIEWNAVHKHYNGSIVVSILDFQYDNVTGFKKLIAKLILNFIWNFRSPVNAI